MSRKLFKGFSVNQIMRADGHFLDTMRTIGDAEADEVISQLVAAGSLQPLYTALRLGKEEIKTDASPSVISDFLLGNSQSPVWFDTDMLRRGQQFFTRYALEIMGLLGAMSLPYCYAASPGNKAIYLTEKMRKVPGMRLLETAHFIIEVMKEGSFEDDGVGIFEVRKTRLVHALVRHHVLNRTSWNPAWGFPINQEDMAGTNLAFSFVIIKGMLQSGFRLTESEIESFLYAWRFIGFQLGIDERLLPANTSEADTLEEAIRLRHFRESDEAPKLIADLLQHYRESFPPPASWLVDSQIRYFVGPEISSILKIEANPVKDRIIKALNFVRRYVNSTFNNPFSYRIMIRNHYKLKEKYSALRH